MKKLKDFFSQFAAKPAEDPEALAEKLLNAVTLGNIEEAKTALAAHADVNCRNHIAETALIVATREKQPEAVSLLLENKADVTLENSFSQTALHYALREGAGDDISLALIDAGAPLTGQDKHGATPAFYAAQTGNTTVLAILAAKGVDLKIPNRYGTTPLMMGLHHREAVDELLKHDFGIDMQDNDGRTVLMHAALLDRADLVQKFIDLGADVHLKDKEGATALSLCRQHGIGGETLSALEKAENAHAEQFHAGSEQAITPMKKIVFAPRRVSA